MKMLKQYFLDLLKLSIRYKFFLFAVILVNCVDSKFVSNSIYPILTPPADENFIPFYCNGSIASDPVGDTPGGSTHRDIVGETSYPAIFHAIDTNYLYLRMRLDGDPVQSAEDLKSFGWGYEFDQDNVLNTYEYLYLVNGISSDTITWEQNTVQESIDSPADPAEVEIKNYTPAIDYWHVKTADSNFNNDTDYFLTIAIPITDLNAVGISLTEPIKIWAATSNSAHLLNVDFACHDGNSSEDPQLSTGGLDATILNPDVDPDGDGILSQDETNIGTNPENPDSDGDGIGDYQETDGGSAVDTDSDGTIDALDLDSDNDGVLDSIEGTDDSDNDGIPNYRDPDDDNDGIPTAEEDINDDENPANDDTDGDNIPNYLDPDDDNDGFPTIDEDTDGDGDPLNDDSDSDGTADYLDPDSVPDNDYDDDGVENSADNCPYASNPGQEDENNDGVGDICQDDFDSDEIINEDDNCPNNPNPGQEDIDNDETGDVCDSDIDGDGFENLNDCAPRDPERFPGNTEKCDGKDNDCDTFIDEDNICGDGGIPDAGTDTEDGSVLSIGSGGGGCSCSVSNINISNNLKNIYVLFLVLVLFVLKIREE